MRWWRGITWSLQSCKCQRLFTAASTCQVLCDALTGRGRNIEICLMKTRRKWISEMCWPSFAEIILRYKQAYQTREIEIPALWISLANLQFAVSSSKITPRARLSFTPLCKKHEHAVLSLRPATSAMMWPRAQCSVWPSTHLHWGINSRTGLANH